MISRSRNWVQKIRSLPKIFATWLQFLKGRILPSFIQLYIPFSDRLYGIGNMSETQFSDDPLSINEDRFLPLFQKQLSFRGFNESLLSTIRNFNLFDIRNLWSRSPILQLALKQQVQDIHHCSTNS